MLALPAGYALARLAGRVGQSLGVGIFLTYLVPPTLLFIPFFWVINQVHLQNSIWSLVLVYPSFTVPFSTWLLMGFFKTIPKELEDAALVDGASRIKTLTRVVFPISIPGILTVVIFSFSLVVNEFVYAFTFISPSENKMVSTGVYTDLIRGDLPEWGAIMVAALIPSIPLALLYNTFLDRFIAGFHRGGLPLRRRKERRVNGKFRRSESTRREVRPPRADPQAGAGAVAVGVAGSGFAPGVLRAAQVQGTLAQGRSLADHVGALRPRIRHVVRQDVGRAMGTAATTSR